MLLGILYERYATYDMAQLGGIASKLPGLATLFVITSLSLIGLPALNGFVGEFMILSGSFQSHPRFAATATLGVILSAAYMLWMLQRVFYGAPSQLVAQGIHSDINGRERCALWPTLALMLAMGVASVFWMRAIDATVPAFAPTLRSTPNSQHRKDDESPMTVATSTLASLVQVAPALRILPEILLTLTGVLVMLAEPLLAPKSSRKPLGVLAILGTLAAIAASAWQLHLPDGTAFFDTVRTDAFSVFFHLLIGGIVLVTLLVSLDYFEGHSTHIGEFYALVLFGAVGMMFMTSAIELLMVFIGLEISSISTYILAGYRKHSATSSEASIKYFLLGSFATAFFLYGVALCFGATGTTNIYRHRRWCRRLEPRRCC